MMIVTMRMLVCVTSTLELALAVGTVEANRIGDIGYASAQADKRGFVAARMLCMPTACI